MIRLGRILASRPGSRWEVVLIEVGRSQNGWVYTEECLREAAPLFERVPANAFPVMDAEGNVLGFDHVKDEQRVGLATLNQVGFYEHVRYDEARRALVGELVFLDNDVGQAYQRHLEALAGSNALDTIGLSIDAEGPVEIGSMEARLTRAISCDIVSHPAAGGRIGQRIAASSFIPARRNPMNLLEALKKRTPRLCEGLSASDSEKVILKHMAKRIAENEQAAAEAAAALGFDVAQLANVDSEVLIGHLEKLIAFVKSISGMDAAEEEDGGGGDAPAVPAEERQAAATPSEDEKRLKEAADKAEAELKELRKEKSASWLDRAADQRRLTEASRKRLKKVNEGRIFESFDEADAAAKDEQEYADTLISGSRPEQVRVLRESTDKATDIFTAMLSRHYRESDAAKTARGEMRDLNMSLHRFMEAFAGIDVRDAIGDRSKRRRLAEAVNTTNFDQVFADALSRALLAEYGGLERYQTWRRLVRFRSYNDFRTHRLIQLGYYANLPTVAKGGTYGALTTPTDREETIALAKKGGTESILLEDMLNDDLGVWQAMIERLGRAAAETAYETVMALIRTATQPTMSDTNKLTAAGRSPANQLTTTLTADATGKTTFLTAVRQMMAQTGGSGVKKGVMPTSIIIPLELTEAWSQIRHDLAGGLTGTEVSDALGVLASGRGGSIVPETLIDFGASDANDWYLHSNEVENLVFATLGGREEPEIFVADDERFGNMFTKDQIDLKIRFIFAAAAVDWVGVQGNVAV